jgi:prevent-host-death family protein
VIRLVHFGVQEVVAVRVGVAEARRRFSELLDRAIRGERVEVARRGEVVAVIGPPVADPSSEPIATALDRWREEWGVDAWPDDDPFAGVRDRSDGRPAPW